MNKVVKNIAFIALGVTVVSSCTTDPDSPGLEYMPDMYRSPAVEAYVDYGEIRNETNNELKVSMSARQPAHHTIPFNANMEEAKYNMPLPFKAPYASDVSHNLYGWDMYATAKDQEEAFNTVVKDYPNPIPFSNGSLEHGKELYTQFCTVCHGETGKGDAKVGKKIGAADLTTGAIKEYTPGQVFYSITYGKNAMGAHGMLMNRTERWQTVQYVRALQNGGKYPSAEDLGLNTKPNDSTGRYESAVLKNVYFNTGSAVMNMTKSQATMNQLVAFLRMNASTTVEISGHTDNTGDAELNMNLSSARAVAVRDYLMALDGINADQIVTKGYGDAKPIDSNDTDMGRQNNRRTEVVIVQQ